MKIDCSTVEIDKIKENEHVAARYRHNGIPGNCKGEWCSPCYHVVKELPHRQ